MTFDIGKFLQLELSEKTPAEIQQYLADLEIATSEGASFVSELNKKIASYSEPEAINKVINVSSEAMQRFSDLLITPKTKAWARISELLSDAQSDAVISNNEEAVEFLSIVKMLSDGAWGHWDLQRVFRPIADHISSEKASNAARQKNEEPRAWVLTEWENRTDKWQKKAPFSRQYSPLVKKKFDLVVNPETIARDWIPKSKT